MYLSIQEAPFDAGDLLNRFTAQTAAGGAIVTFGGIVRQTDRPLIALEIEHYPAMSERAIAAMMGQAMQRWQLLNVMVVHRHGRLALQEPIMMVATAANHRVEAFCAAEFLMDYLKSRAPFWKKEIFQTGENWVSPRCADETALKRWE